MDYLFIFHIFYIRYFKKVLVFKHSNLELELGMLNNSLRSECIDFSMCFFRKKKYSDHQINGTIFI